MVIRSLLPISLETMHDCMILRSLLC
jgi:hypothetical protein